MIPTVDTENRGLEKAVFHPRPFGYNTNSGASWCQSHCAVRPPKLQFTWNWHKDSQLFVFYPAG